MAGVALLVGCGGGQAKPESPPEPSMEQDDTESTPEAIEEEEAPPAPTGRVSMMGSDLPPPVPEDWELKQRDCDDLGAKYETLLRDKELEKLEARKLTGKQLETARNNVAKTAAEGARNWMQACAEIVGTIQNKGDWECAFKATTLDQFHTCLHTKGPGGR